MYNWLSGFNVLLELSSGLLPSAMESPLGGSEKCHLNFGPPKRTLVHSALVSQRPVHNVENQVY